MLSLKKVTREAMRELEGKIIVKALQTHNWNRRRAASALEISYRALLYKLKEAGFPTRKSRQNPQTAGLAEEGMLAGNKERESRVRILSAGKRLVVASVMN